VIRYRRDYLLLFIAEIIYTKFIMHHNNESSGGGSSGLVEVYSRASGTPKNLVIQNSLHLSYIILSNFEGFW